MDYQLSRSIFPFEYLALITDNREHEHVFFLVKRPKLLIYKC